MLHIDTNTLPEEMHSKHEAFIVCKYREERKDIQQASKSCTITPFGLLYYSTLFC